MIKYSNKRMERIFWMAYTLQEIVNKLTGILKNITDKRFNLLIKHINPCHTWQGFMVLHILP